MTTEPLSPATPEPHPDDVDLLASRLVDGDVSAEQIPDALREGVEQRAAEFSKLRTRLQESRSPIESPVLREAQISVALRSSSSSRGFAVFRQRTSRVVLAAAASIIGVLVLSTVVQQQDDSGDVDMFAESINDDSGESEALSQSAPAFDSESGSSKSSSSDSAPPEVAMATTDDDMPPLPVYSSVDDIGRIAASLPSAGTVSEGLNQMVEVPRCAVGSRPPLRTESALLEGVRVEIHYRERGEFAVYDISNCSMMTSRPASP